VQLCYEGHFPEISTQMALRHQNFMAGVKNYSSITGMKQRERTST